jgi:hypothetical protein
MLGIAQKIDSQFDRQGAGERYFYFYFYYYFSAVRPMAGEA